MDVRAYPSVIEPIAARAAADPGCRAFVLLHEDGRRETISAGELWQAMLGAAGGLSSAGIGAGDIVIVAVGHSRQLIATFLGAIALGAVPSIVPTLGPRMDAAVYTQRLAAVIRNAAAKAIVHDRGDADELFRALGEGACPAIDVSRVMSAGAAVSLPRLTPADNCFLQYTSGSGGVQKGVMNTHGNVLRFLETKRTGHGIDADDVVVSWLPLYHDLGVVSGVLAPQVIGGSAVLMSPQHWVRSPAILMQAIHEYRGTQCYMPNFALNHCAQTIRDADLRGVDLGSLKSMLLGGEPVRAASLQVFAERFANYGFRMAALRAGYGMAEMVEGTTISSTSGPPNVDWVSVAALQNEQRAVPVEARSDGAVSFVSCGPAMPRVEMRIVDAQGSPLAERGVGEIRVRSDFVCRGYHNRPELTQARFEDGWLRTGDYGYLVGGDLYVIGRQADLIIIGGRNISPEEIEAVADGVVGVKPGRSIAFGVADARRGTERVVLLCETTLADDAAPERLALERELRRRTLQAFEVSLSEVRFVPRGWILKSSSGKHARPATRAKYQAALASEAGGE